MQRGGETGASVAPGKLNTRVGVYGANVQPNSAKKKQKGSSSMPPPESATCV